MKIKYALSILIFILIATIIIAENDVNRKYNFVVEKNGSLNSYFCLKNICESEYFSLISNSTKIKCAFYDLSDKNITLLLKEKNADILIDEDNYANYGEKIVGEGLMHNKFCVLDDKITITGSFNPTKNNKNDNNMIVIHSKTIAKNYESEFKIIKNDETPKRKAQSIILGNITVNNYFCPEDNCEEKILNELNLANQSVEFLAFTFTDKLIAQAIIKKHEENLSVRGIIESFQSHKLWTYPLFEQANISVKIDEKPTLQHNKVFIIDNNTVITGSFNPTWSANHINKENILIIHDEKTAHKFDAYFAKLYNNII